MHNYCAMAQGTLACGYAGRAVLVVEWVRLNNCTAMLLLNPSTLVHRSVLHHLEEDTSL